MNTKRELIHAFLHQGKCDAITKVAEILHPGKKAVSVMESYVDGVRLVTDSNTIKILYPFKMMDNYLMESALAEAISSGTIYDDAEKIKDHADLISMTTLPNKALANNDLPEATGIKMALTPVISKMNDDGRFDVTDADMTNGVNCVKDLCRPAEDPDSEVRKVMDNYIADKDELGENDKAPISIGDIVNDVRNVNNVAAEDTIGPDGYDEVEYNEGEEDEALRQEGFITHRPKKLKPITRDIVPYVNEQMRNIGSTNDQAMLAGYVSNKLEFIDFYITVIDTHDDRFIVPHSRDYLVSLQNDLNRLLTQILNTRPVNKYERVWKMNLPAGYEG